MNHNKHHFRQWKDWTIGHFYRINLPSLEFPSAMRHAEGIPNFLFLYITSCPLSVVSDDHIVSKRQRLRVHCFVDCTPTH